MTLAAKHKRKRDKDNDDDETSSTEDDEQNAQSSADDDDDDDYDVITVFCDGCSRNNGSASAIAGSGVHFVSSTPRIDLSCRVPGRQTNGRAELFAAALALVKTLDAANVLLRPDASYVADGITDPTRLTVKCMFSNKFLLSSS